MEIYVKQVTSWSRALDAARMTVGKVPLHKEPSDEWKDKMLMAEHSPIRLVEYDIYLKDIPSFVATHLVRHHIGCEKFVCSKRDDRGGGKPENINRLTPVDMMITCNAQSLINISKDRLCSKAHPETIKVWKAVKNAIAEIDPIMAKHMVRKCEYRNMCPEKDGCGYYKIIYKKDLEYAMKSEYPISEEDAANFKQIQQ